MVMQFRDTTVAKENSSKGLVRRLMEGGKGRTSIMDARSRGEG